MTLRKIADSIDGTPEKRIFLSIIADYDLRTGLCELVDNAIDMWLSNGKSSSDFIIHIELNIDRQIISVTDNAGGVGKDQLRFLIAPGASSNSPYADVIGIFGVGGKRAGVALGERIEIRTRHKSGKTFELDIDSEWIGSDDWYLDAYEVDPIDPGTTSIEISKVRQNFSKEDAATLRRHLGEVYSWYIQAGCKIDLNGDPIEPLMFDKWAYPPGYAPRKLSFEIEAAVGEKLYAELNAGLIYDRDAEVENYGVYFYCNDRLIVKELRSRDVGYFVTSEAGVPHPDASLCRVIVKLRGGAKLMPWNSSKSGLNYNHPAFGHIRPALINLVSYYSGLSRRLKSDWTNQVFRYKSGEPDILDAAQVGLNKRLVLPKLPRSRALPRGDQLKTANVGILRDKPWTVGLVEAMGLVDLISRQKAETKNRAALILLDSNFEIGLKEFIVSRVDLFPPHTYNDSKILQIFKSRHAVITEVSAHVNFTTNILSKVSHYYNLRNKLVHERATVGITDTQIADYRATIEKVLSMLFGLKFPRG